MIPNKQKALWHLYLFPALMIWVFSWFAAPIVCMFVTRKLKVDRVKRLGKVEVELPRDNLVWWLNLFNTHDNNSDEGWYGAYEVKSVIPFLTAFLATVTQEMYDNSRIIRWYYRVWWLQRNCAYGWHYWLFSMPVEPTQISEKGIDGEIGYEYITIRPSSYQIQAIRPLFKGYKNDINIGWKAHKGKPNLLYANRFFAPRKL